MDLDGPKLYFAALVGVAQWLRDGAVNPNVPGMQLISAMNSQGDISLQYGDNNNNTYPKEFFKS